MAPLPNIKNIVWSAIVSGSDSWARSLLDWTKRKSVIVRGAPRTPTFEDDFDTASNWTPIGDGEVTINNGQIEIRTDTESDANYIRYISPERFARDWILRFKYEKIRHDSGQLWLYLSNSFTGELNQTFSMGLNIDGTTDSWRAFVSNDQPLANGSYSAIPNQTSTGAGDRWVEIQSNDQNLHVRIYGDESYETLLSEQSMTIPADFGGRNESSRLGRIIFRHSSADTGIIHANIDDLKFWDDTKFVNPIPNLETPEYPPTLSDITLPIKIEGDTNLQRKTAETFESDFTSDSGWVIVGSGVKINTTSESLNIDSTFDGSPHLSIYDLGSALSNEFRLDIDLDFTGSSIGTGGADDVYIGLFSGDTINAVQDGLYWRIRQFTDGAGISRMFLSGVNNSTLNSPSTNTRVLSPTNDLTPDNLKVGRIYLSIIRLSPTLIRGEIYADRARTILLERTADITISSTLTNLRYVGVKNQTVNDPSAEWHGSIDKIRIWDGTTNPVTQNPPSYDEDFTGDSFEGWTFRGDGNEIDQTNDTLDYNIPGTTSPTSNGASFDLQRIFGDGFTVDRKFRLEIIGVNITERVNQIVVGLSPYTHLNGVRHGNVDGTTILIQSTAMRLALYGDTETDMFDLGYNDGLTDASFVLKSDGEVVTLEIYDGSTITGTPVNTQTLSDHQNRNHRYFTVQGAGASLSSDGIGTINSIKFWNGTDTSNPNGENIVFGTNQTSYPTKAISYNPISGDYFGYVRLPTLQAAIDTELKMYYGNESNYAPPNEDVWDDNYEGVYEFEGSDRDETTNGRTLTKSGDIISTDVGRGDSGYRFTGNNDNIELSSDNAPENIWSGGGSLSLKFEYDSLSNITLVDKNTYEISTRVLTNNNIRIDFTLTYSGGVAIYRCEMPPTFLNGTNYMDIHFDSDTPNILPDIIINGREQEVTSVFGIPSGTFNSDANFKLSLGNDHQTNDGDSLKGTLLHYSHSSTSRPLTHSTIKHAENDLIELGTEETQEA